MPDATSRARRLALARGYPYAIPTRSFVYRDGGTALFDAALTEGRTPVLAIGSNQSPQRLAQKFGHDASHVIPVQRATLADFDVVYSAHVARYGAVPAMLQVSAGSVVAVAVTWLDDAQLELMHESETAAANYRFAELDAVRLTFDDGRSERRAFAYLSARGYLNDGGAPVALAAVGCARRRFAALTTAEVLERVRERVAPGMDPDAFVHRLIDDEAYRRDVVDALAIDAGAFAYPARPLC